MAQAATAFAANTATEPPRQRPTARSIMTDAVVTVAANTTVVKAAETLSSRGVSNAPVVEPDFTRQILLGFVSEKDILQCYASGHLYRHPDLLVSAIMRPHPVSVKPETDLFTLAAIFMQHGFRHLPVTEAQILRGVVSRRDVLNALMDDFRDWNFRDPAQRTLPDLAGIFTPRFLLG